MKTTLRSLVVLLFLFGSLSVGVRTTSASTTSTAYFDDFSGGDIPSGWDNSSYSWYYSYNGDGDYNGSLVCNLYDYWFGADPIVSPPIDASLWNNAADEAYVDFDFFWEYNDYNADNGDDNFQVFLTNSNGQQQLLDLYTSSDYTYYDADGSYQLLRDPDVSSDSWRHYHIAIPQSFRTSDLKIKFQGNPGWGCSNPAIDNLQISGVHYNSITIAPSPTVDLGNVSMDDTNYKTVLLTNPNSVPVNISNVGVAGSGFMLAYAATTIQPNSVDSIVVGFSPLAGGSSVGDLTFNTDADYPTSVDLALKAVGITPKLVVGAATLFQKAHVRLGTSLSQSVTVSNGGPGSLILLPSTHLAGDYPSEYSIVRVPSEGMKNGDLDSITVSYHPTLEGLHSALLYIESDGGEQIVELRGVGILPHITVTPSSFTFAPTPVGQQVSQTFTVANPGTDTLQIVKNYFASADYDFSYSGITGKPKLAPGQSMQFTVNFAPIDRGTRLATLRLTTNIPPTISSPSVDTSGYDIYLTGDGVPVGVLSAAFALDSSAIGVTDTRTATLTNNGTESLTINSLNIVSGNVSDFAISGQTFPLTMAAGASKTIAVSFTPSARGARSINLQANITTNDLTQNVTFVDNGVGLLACANPSADVLFNSAKVLAGTTDTELVTITNCGDIPTAYSTAVTGVTGPYTVIPSVSPVVAPGGTTTFQVVFAPTSLTQSQASLTLTGGPGVTPMVVNLMGNGLGVTATASGDAGMVTVGTTKPFTVTVTNNGNTDWTPGNATITGANSADFAVSAQITPAIIATGSSGTLTINFTPSVATAESATLLFTSATPAPFVPFSFTLNGIGASSGVSSETAIEGYSLKQNYPNPANTSTTLTFALPNEVMVQIGIADAKGNMLQTVASGRFTSGEHSTLVDLKSLASGSYYFILETNGLRLAREFTVIR